MSFRRNPLDQSVQMVVQMPTVKSAIDQSDSTEGGVRLLCPVKD